MGKVVVELTHQEGENVRALREEEEIHGFDFWPLGSQPVGTKTDSSHSKKKLIKTT